MIEQRCKYYTYVFTYLVRNVTNLTRNRGNNKPVRDLIKDIPGNPNRVGPFYFLVAIRGTSILSDVKL